MVSTVATNIVIAPLTAFLFQRSVCCKMVHRLVRTSKSCSAGKSVVFDGGEQFVKRWQSANRAVVTNCFHISFFVDHILTYSSPCFWCAIFLLQHFVEGLSDHFFRRCVVLGPDSLVVTCTSSCVNYDISFFTSSLQLFLLVAHSCFHVLRLLYFCSKLSFGKLLAVEFTKDMCNSFSGCDCLAFVVFTFGMSDPFLPDFMHDILLMPLNSSRICCIFSCRFVLVLSNDAFFAPLAQFFQFVFFSFRSVSPLLNESSDLMVSFTGLFVFVFLRLRHNIFFLCFFCGCCFVCIFTQVACCFGMCFFTQILCCCDACIFIQIECCCGSHNKSHFHVLDSHSNLLRLPPQVSLPRAGIRWLRRLRLRIESNGVLP